MTQSPTSNRAALRKVLVVLLYLASVDGAAAQSSNVEILQQLAVKCLMPEARSFSNVTLLSDRQHPFLDQAIAKALRDAGAEVFFDTGLAVDTTGGRRSTARLTYFVAGASIRYAGKGRRQVERFVTLNLGYLIQDPEGRVTSDSTCSDSYRDEIPRSQLDSVESSTMPITQGVRPRRSWVRRYAEPVVVGAATAVAVYLFFNVRSDTNDSP